MSQDTPLPQSRTTRSGVHEQVLACLRGTWRSLVVVPAGPNVPAALLAEALVEASQLVSTTPTRLIHAEGQAESAISHLIVEMVDHAQAGGRVVVAADPVLDRQAAIPFVLAADAALLCVRLGHTRIEDARRTIELIGKERFLGAVTVEGGKA